MGELCNGRHNTSGCSDNLRGVSLTSVDDDLAEAADVEHVIVLLKRIAAEVGLHREAVAADARAVQLVAFIPTIAGSTKLEATDAALEGAHAAGR